MQGSQSERRLVVTQSDWDRMIVSSDWTEEELAERFIVAQPPSAHTDFDAILNHQPSPTNREQRRRKPQGIRHRRR